MLHWIAVIIGIVFLFFQLFYAFMIISSLIENTGYKGLSIINGAAHAAMPALFVFFAYQCLLRKIAQFGMVKAVLIMAVCFIIYFAIVSVWNRIVLGEVPEMWKIGLLTVAEAAVTAIFIYGFLCAPVFSLNYLIKYLSCCIIRLTEQPASSCMLPVPI